MQAMPWELIELSCLSHLRDLPGASYVIYALGHKDLHSNQ